MCFVASLQCKRQKAVEDVIVYKVVKYPKYKYSLWPFKKRIVSVKSLVQDYPYRINALNVDIALEKELIGECLIIKQGYHSFSNYRASVVYTDLHETNKHFDICVIKCIIPKGTDYYENKEVYVSSNIIITKDIITL